MFSGMRQDGKKKTECTNLICDGSNEMGRGMKIRKIVRNAQNGGEECEARDAKQHCEERCPGMPNKVNIL